LGFPRGKGGFFPGESCGSRGIKLGSQSGVLSAFVLPRMLSRLRKSCARRPTLTLNGVPYETKARALVRR